MVQTQRKPGFAATMMGAVPYRDVEHTSDVILKYFPEAPRLPVMTRSIRWMLEGLPCLVIDREKKRIIMVPPEQREKDVVEFYERVESKDLEHFAVSDKKMPFFTSMLEKIKQAGPGGLKWVAFQMGGPVVIADTIRQTDGYPAVYHETLRDIIIKGINMKSLWMEKRIREALPGIEIISDQPEPSLVSFTGAGGTGSRQDLIQAINDGFKDHSCLKWVHCCANIDWTLLTEAQVDIINFDAYQYAGKVSLYAEEFDKFLNKGGMIGWGIVPVIQDILKNQNAGLLLKKLEDGIAFFVERGIDEETLARASWVLPSCETVLLSEQDSDYVFRITKEISDIMKKKYGFNPVDKQL